MRWNHTINHREPQLVVGFASVLQEPAQPKVITPEPARKITSVDQIHSIWKWESKLNWLVPDLLAEASVNLLSGASDVGKTWFALYLAGAVAHGRPVFGEDVSQRKVVYLDGENPAYVVKQKLFDLGIPETPNLIVWGGWEAEPAPALRSVSPEIGCDNFRRRGRARDYFHVQDKLEVLLLPAGRGAA